MFRKGLHWFLILVIFMQLLPPPLSVQANTGSVSVQAVSNSFQSTRSESFTIANLDTSQPIRYTFGSFTQTIPSSNYNGTTLNVNLQGVAKTVQVKGTPNLDEYGNPAPVSHWPGFSQWRHADGVRWIVNDDVGEISVATDPLQKVDFPSMAPNLANRWLNGSVDFSYHFGTDGLLAPWFNWYLESNNQSVPLENVNRSRANVTIKNNELENLTDENDSVRELYYDVRKTANEFRGYYKFKFTPKYNDDKGTLLRVLCDESTTDLTIPKCSTFSGKYQEPNVRGVEYAPIINYYFQSTATLYDYGGTITYSVKNNPVTVQDRFYNFNKTQFQTPAPQTIHANVAVGEPVNYTIPPTKTYNGKTYRAESSFLSIGAYSTPVSFSHCAKVFVMM